MPKATRTILLLLTLLIASCAVSVADEKPEGQNAAPLYEAIWGGHLGFSEISRGIHEESNDLGEPDWTPGPVISSELADQDRMARIIIATQAAYCDFNLDYSLGPELQLPHHSTSPAQKKQLWLIFSDFRIPSSDFHRNFGAVGSMPEPSPGLRIGAQPPYSSPET